MPLSPAPSVSDIEAAILADEGDHHVEGRYCASHDTAARHRRSAAERLIRDAQRARAVAVREAQHPAHRSGSVSVSVSAPLTRCVWCARTIPCGAPAVCISRPLFHEACAQEFMHAEPEDERILESPVYPVREQYACP